MRCCSPRNRRIIIGQGGQRTEFTSGTLASISSMSPALKTPVRIWPGKATVAIMGVYLLLSLGTLFTTRPQVDESLHANPGYNLLYNGRMAASLYEMRGYLPLSSYERTYYYPPLFFLTTAVWYRIVGFGVVQLRLLSVLCGLLALYSWSVIARSLFQSPTVVWMVTGLVSIDYFFVLGAAQGRMDMQCAALGIAAIAVYLSRREESLGSALFWSYALATMSVLTHQSGLGYWLGLAFVTLYFDRRRLSLKMLALAAIPCLIGGLGWGAYIAQDPNAFVAQMRGTMAIGEQAFEAGHWSSIHLIRNFQKELIFRYAGPFGLMPGVGLAQRLKALVLLAYIVGVAGSLVMSRRRPNLLVLPVLTIISFSYLGFMSPSKFAYYLPHTTMYMAACLAVFLCHLELPERARKRALIGVVLVVAAIQVTGLLYRIKQDPYRRSFLPAVAAIEQHSAPDSLVIGSGELWFHLQGERRILHDPSVGYREGLKPDIFVMDPLYRELHERDRLTDLPMYTYVQNYLDRWQLVYDDGYYQVYVPPADKRAAVPAADRGPRSWPVQRPLGSASLASFKSSRCLNVALGGLTVFGDCAEKRWLRTREENSPQSRLAGQTACPTVGGKGLALVAGPEGTPVSPASRNVFTAFRGAVIVANPPKG